MKQSTIEKQNEFKCISCGMKHVRGVMARVFGGYMVKICQREECASRAKKIRLTIIVPSILSMFLFSACSSARGPGVFSEKSELNFIVAGQSNSVSPGNGSTGYSKLGKTTINDFYNGNEFRVPTQAQPMDSGLAWLELGDLFKKPVRFTSVGNGGTNTRKWRDYLYLRIMERLNTGEKFDALLWIQGESDAGEGFSEQESYENLKWVILETRKVDPNLKWFVALDKTPGAQMRVIREGLAFQGPDIDALRSKDASWFEPTGGEFAGEGFRQHALAWFEILSVY